jgi:hypothetical protein
MAKVLFLQVASIEAALLRSDWSQQDAGREGTAVALQMERADGTRRALTRGFAVLNTGRRCLCGWGCRLRHPSHLRTNRSENLVLQGAQGTAFCVRV